MMYAETFRWVLEDHILPLDVRVQISLSLSLSLKKVPLLKKVGEPGSYECQLRL